MNIGYVGRKEQMRETMRLKGYATTEAYFNAQKQEKQRIDDNLGIVRFKKELIYNISGIYFLYFEERIVYIGESECVISRISEHVYEGEKKFDSFSFSAFNGNSISRKKKEKELIRRFTPKYNVIHNFNNRHRKPKIVLGMSRT